MQNIVCLMVGKRGGVRNVGSTKSGATRDTHGNSPFIPMDEVGFCRADDYSALASPSGRSRRGIGECSGWLHRRTQHLQFFLFSDSVLCRHVVLDLRESRNAGNG